MMDPMALPLPGYHPSNQPMAASPDPLIDPALAIDPAILGESNNNEQSGLSPYPADARPPSPTSAPKFQFEQGPQGDPFAPQPNQTFLPPPERLPSSLRPLKRKRKTRPVARRDEDCGFCQGDDSSNTNGQAEQMVSCVACGRSGHPSCLSIAGIADVLRSYPWHCIECKICEVCEKKGNGNRMLFCDACDRGWHMDCLDPPLESTPNGSWVCPICPPIPLPPSEEIRPSSPPSIHVSTSPAPSIASSSRLPQQNEPASRSRASKGQRKTHDDSEGDDGPPRVRQRSEQEARVGNKGRGKGKGKGKGKIHGDVKGKGRARASQAPEESSVSLKVPPRLRMSMRARLKNDSSSPDPPVPVPRKVRLVVKKPKVVEGEADEDEDDEGPAHMFEAVLTPEECSTVNTAVHDSDKSLFNRSRTRAELKLGPPVTVPHFPFSLLTPGPPTPVISTPAAGPSSGPGLVHSLRTRHSFAQVLQSQATLDNPPSTPQSGGATSHTQSGAALPPRIKTIRFGEYDIDTWYDAPFPEEYASVADSKLWICEFCLKYMKSRFQSTRHRMKCKARHPPGDEIYRDAAISVFEVDGRKNKIYCQNLCLLSKMFLDHKSLFYDVEPFLFYVMTEVDRLGARFVGYFSKEKRSPKDYNVSCIMTLPVRQRRGWGNILIDFSYLLSKKENRVGSPERPLSALGALAYTQYWTHTVKLFLHAASEPVTMQDISRGTSMTLEDIYNTLCEQKMITAKEVSPPPPLRPPPGTPIKYLRGRKNGPGITRRGLARTNTKEETKAPLVLPTEYTIHWDREAVDAYVVAWEAKEPTTIKPRCLKWSPFLLSRARKTETVGSGTGAIGGLATAAVTEIDRSSASSTKVPQGAPLDVAVTTPTLEFAETQSPELAAEVEDTKLAVRRTTSREASQIAQDQAVAVELASEPRRILRTRSKSLRQASTDLAKSSPSGSDKAPPRTLRSRTSINHVKRARITEDDDTVGDTSDEAELLEDSTSVAQLAREDSSPPSQRTRSASSYKTDPPKRATPRVSPRKRRRVESSPEPEPEADADGSLSELTRTSPSPSPSPLPRRVTRAANGQLRSQGLSDTTRENGTKSKGTSARSTRLEAQPLASGIRSSSRINGASHIPSPDSPGLKRSVVVEETQDAHTRSTQRAKGEPLHDDQEAQSKVSAEDKQKVAEPLPAKECEAEQSLSATSLNGVAQIVNEKGLEIGTPGMYDEDALGEEDAEGEEDPDPDSCVEE